MTRKEQIEAAAKEYANRNYSTLVQVMSHGNSFLEGCIWADQNIDPGMVELLNRLPKAVTIIDRLEAKLAIAVEALDKIAKYWLALDEIKHVTEVDIKDVLNEIKDLE